MLLVKKMKTMMLLSGVSALGLRPTPNERARGRWLRDEAGHADAAPAGGAAAAPGAAGADGAAAPAGGDQGGPAGTGADGAGAAGADGAAAPETVLGEAAAEADAGGVKGEGEAAAEGTKPGEAEGKEEGGKGDGPAFEVLGAPEKYELTLPPEMVEAGVTFDQEAFDLVEPVLREMNLSNEAAGALVSAYAEKVMPLLIKRADDASDAAGADMRNGWLAEAKADPDIGGGKFDETKAFAKQTFLRFGVKSDSPFLKLMEESGLGNHPEMLRFISNVGRSTGEAGAHRDNPGGKGGTRLADRVYGTPIKAE